SSLNWALPVVSSNAGRVMTAGLTVLIGVAGADADSFFGGAAGAEVTTSWHAAQHRAIAMRPSARCGVTAPPDRPRRPPADTPRPSSCRAHATGGRRGRSG